MALYRTIHLSFWTDSKVVDDFTPEDKYFYLYLMTNPHTNLCGCYEVSMNQVSNETGYGKEQIGQLLDRMDRMHNVIRYSPETKEILILNWHKYNWTKSEDFHKPLRREIANVKNDVFREYLSDLEQGIDTVLRPSIDRPERVVTPSIDGAGTTDTLSVTNTVPVTVSITESKQVKDTSNVKPSKERRSRYGEYHHVLLTDEEHDKLLEQMGEHDTTDYIRRVDEYCEQKGKSYKNYYLTILNWWRRDDGEKKSNEDEDFRERIKRVWGRWDK